MGRRRQGPEVLCPDFNLHIASHPSPIVNRPSSIDNRQSEEVVAIPARTANQAALAGTCKLKSPKL